MPPHLLAYSHLSVRNGHTSSWLHPDQWSRRWEKPPTANVYEYVLFTFSDNKTLSLQLTSVLPVTCYIPVLWTEQWLQWQSDHWLWGCSGVCRHEHTWDRLTLNKFHLFVAMAMTIPPAPAGTIHATVLVHQIVQNSFSMHTKRLIVRCLMYKCTVVWTVPGGEELSWWLANWVIDTDWDGTGLCFYQWWQGAHRRYKFNMDGGWLGHFR